MAVSKPGSETRVPDLMWPRTRWPPVERLPVPMGRMVLTVRLRKRAGVRVLKMSILGVQGRGFEGLFGKIVVDLNAGD